MANKLFWALKEKTKDELIKIAERGIQQTATWSEAAMKMASYYYNIEPHASMFNDKTFNVETLGMIKARAQKERFNMPYKRVTFIKHNMGDRIKDLPVDVLKLTDEQYDAFLNTIKEIAGLNALKELEDKDGSDD